MTANGELEQKQPRNIREAETGPPDAAGKTGRTLHVLLLEVQESQRYTLTNPRRTRPEFI
jgi:hypothetical protein